MPKNNLGLTRDWVLKSQNDLESAKILFKENGPTDSLCFHCHQTAEKMLKGFLVFKRGEFPKIHDLILLLNLCKKIDSDFKKIEDEVSFLNRYYIETRYPSEVMVYSRKECQQALEAAQKLTQFVIKKINID